VAVGVLVGVGVLVAVGVGVSVGVAVAVGVAVGVGVSVGVSVGVAVGSSCASEGPAGELHVAKSAIALTATASDNSANAPTKTARRNALMYFRPL
jgi:hypothetical protein